MNFKKIQNKFWARKASGEEGFTLVELIVVIAILGILAGVGTVAYSGYVKKANMQADETLVREVQRATVLAVLDDYKHEFSGPVTVKLTLTGASVVTDNADDKALVEKAMKDAFGDGWADMCKLKYDGWTSTAADVSIKYTASSFYDTEGKKIDSLLSKVGNLTGAMGKFFANKDADDMPEAITSVLKGQGIDLTDSTAMANGAVVALSATITDAMEKDPTIRQNIINAVAQGDLTLVAESLETEYGKVYGEGSDMVTLAAAATIYAAAEAFSQHCASAETPYTRPAEILNDIQYTKKDENGVEVPLSSKQILANIITGFGQMQSETFGSSEGLAAAGTYSDKVTKDTDAFLSVLGALNESSDVLKDNLESETFYTDGSAKNLIESYLTVGNIGLASGEAAVIVLPNKDITCYLGGILS